MKLDEVKVEVNTDGVEEATEKIQGLSDAISAFPAQVVIRGARNCTFKIYPSQTMIYDREEKEETDEEERQ